MPDTHATRRARLVAELAGRNLDALLVTDLVNVRYLTGFTGSNGALLLGADGTATLATDGRYTVQAGGEAPDVELLITRTLVADLARRAQGVLGFEEHHITVAEHDALAEHAQLRKAGRLVEQLRQVKDGDELAHLRAAAALADAALADVLPRLRPGVSEREFARALEDRMRDLGAEAPAFDTIVAAGPNGARPHHQPTDRPVQAHELVTIDFGARLAGYHSDCTRTVCVGTPQDWQRELYALVQGAQAAGCAALSPGIGVAEVDAASRTPIGAAGYGEFFPHGLGHGVGLQIHEAPMVHPDSADTLAENVPVTVEPGVYLPDRGGVRIEDTLVVHADGPELLTTSTKDLLVL